MVNRIRVRITNRLDEAQQFNVEVVQPEGAELVSKHMPVEIGPREVVPVEGLVRVPRSIFVLPRVEALVRVTAVGRAVRGDTFCASRPHGRWLMTERKEGFVSRYLAGPSDWWAWFSASFSLMGCVIYMAHRDYDAVAPEAGYYERAINHDEVRQRLQRAELAGLKAEIKVAEAPIPTMPRRIDVLVHDGQGEPVTGLEGRLTAIRPADARLKNGGQLIAVPGQEGLYRLLLKVPVAGLWEFELDAKRGGDAYLMIVRQDVRI